MPYFTFLPEQETKPVCRRIKVAFSRLIDCVSGYWRGGSTRINSGCVILAKGERNNHPVYEGKRVWLRPVKEEDLAQLIKWDSDEEINQWAGKKFSCRNEARRWYLEGRSPDRRTYVIETKESELVGEIEVTNISWRLHMGELRVFIGKKELWGTGIGADAVHAFVKGLFRSTTLKKIFLRVSEQNLRAKHCYLKVGFKPKGRIKFGHRTGLHGSLLLMEISASQFV
jgi:RimJ/RimL family protein N-acetyltransferase